MVSYRICHRLVVPVDLFVCQAGCTSASLEDLKTIAIGAGAGALELLDLTRCSLINSDILHVVVARCHNLKYLNVTACVSLSKDDIDSLAMLAHPTLAIVR
jgi:hypothetical protein